MPGIVASSGFPNNLGNRRKTDSKAVRRKSWLLPHGLGDRAREGQGGKKRPQDGEPSMAGF